MSDPKYRRKHSKTQAYGCAADARAERDGGAADATYDKERYATDPKYHGGS